MQEPIIDIYNQKVTVMGMLWNTRFNSVPFFPELPRINNVAEQTIDSSSYYFEGRKRTGQDWYLFEYSFEGEGIFWDKKGEYRIPKGSGFLCLMSDPETGYKYPAESVEQWKIMYIVFHAEYNLVKSLLDRSGPVYNLEPDSAVILRFLEYRKQAGTIVEVTPGESMMHVNRLLAALADSEIERTLETAGSWLVQEAGRTIRSHLNENLNVSELAHLLRITPEHLCRVFKKETGMTPLAFITREKIRYATDLLHNSSLSCKEICARLNYDNSSHFARTFKKVTGMTPSEFRQRGEMPLF